MSTEWLVSISKCCGQCSDAEFSGIETSSQIDKALQAIVPEKELYRPAITDLIETFAATYQGVFARAFKRRKFHNRDDGVLFNTEMGDLPELCCIQTASIRAEEWKTMIGKDVVDWNEFSRSIVEGNELEDVSYQNVSAILQSHWADASVPHKQLILAVMLSVAKTRALVRLDKVKQIPIFFSLSIAGHFFLLFQSAWSSEFSHSKS